VGGKAAVSRAVGSAIRGDSAQSFYDHALASKYLTRVGRNQLLAREALYFPR
jgi:hypothetical protein